MEMDFPVWRNGMNMHPMEKRLLGDLALEFDLVSSNFQPNRITASPPTINFASSSLTNRNHSRGEQATRTASATRNDRHADQSCNPVMRHRMQPYWFPWVEDPEFRFWFLHFHFSILIFQFWLLHFNISVSILESQFPFNKSISCLTFNVFLLLLVYICYTQLVYKRGLQPTENTCFLHPQNITLTTILHLTDSVYLFEATLSRTWTATWLFIPAWLIWNFGLSLSVICYKSLLRIHVSECWYCSAESKHCKGNWVYLTWYIIMDMREQWFHLDIIRTIISVSSEIWRYLLICWNPPSKTWWLSFVIFLDQFFIVLIVLGVLTARITGFTSSTYSKDSSLNWE